VIVDYESDDAEAAGVAARLRAVHDDGIPWRSLAVLYRTNAQSAAFEEALTRAGVPFRVRGAGRFLERPEVKVALDGLRQAAKHAPGRPFTDLLDELGAPPTDRLIDDRSEERREHVDALARLGREYL